MCVCNSKVVMNAAHGRSPSSPAATPMPMISSAMKAKISAFACQMSIRSSLPIDQAIRAVASSAHRWNAQPPTRCAAAEMTQTITTLIRATPMAAAGPGGSRWANGATSQSYSAPGLFMFSPTLSDAEVHDPRNG